MQSIATGATQAANRIAAYTQEDRASWPVTPQSAAEPVCPRHAEMFDGGAGMDIL